MQQTLLETAREKLERLNTDLQGKDYLFKNAFSIIDAYMFVCLDWLNWVDPKDELKIIDYHILLIHHT